ncbi:hypothetical protein JTB14_034633 [Gonioctena quinquepunctata]|nr:hypothetical protein JTB14_034633 [Gonioctena quinquepunctata]
MLRDNISIYSNVNENNDEGEMEVDGSENIAISLSPSNYNSYPSDATLRINAVNESLGEEESEVSHENQNVSWIEIICRKIQLLMQAAGHSASTFVTSLPSGKESLTGILSHNLV